MRISFKEDLIEELMEKNGAENVETAAIFSLISYICDIAKEITNMAVIFAIHADRKKISLRDIELAIEIYIKNKSEKSLDILLGIKKDIKELIDKIDDIKSDTELIKEYTEPIEEIFSHIEDLEKYLKDHLASDWEKIKDIYDEYIRKEISRRQFIKKCIKIIGNRFIKKVLEKFSPI